MFIYYDSHGVLKELVNDEAIRQGNRDTNKLYFFIEGAEPQVDSSGVYLARYYASGNRVFIDVSGNELTSQSFSITPVTMEIPFNKKRELKHFKYWTKYQMFVINVPDDILNNSGTVGCRIQMINNGEIDTQGFVVFNVEYTGSKAVISPDTAINISQWNYLIANMITKENIGALSGSLVLFYDYDTTTKTLASAVNEIGINTPFVMSVGDELSLCVIVEGDNNGYIVYANNPYGLYESEEAAGTTVLNDIVWYPCVVSDNCITLTSSSGTLNAVQIEYIRKGNCYIKYGSDYYRKVSDDGTTAVFKTYSVYNVFSLISVWCAYVNVTLATGAYVASGQLYQIYDSSVVELKANKVTSVSNTSTDTQYPSAKCVYDNFKKVIDVANGKCSVYCLSYNETLDTSNYGKYHYLNSNSEAVAFTSQQALEDYVDDLTSLNSAFNSQNDTITLSAGYLIVRSVYIATDTQYLILRKDSGTSGFEYSNMKLGDVFLVYETDVPDRWLGQGPASPSGAVLYKMETAKIDLTNYVTTNTDQDITGKKTIKDVDLEIKNTSASYSWSIDEDVYNELRFKYNGATKFYITNGVAITQAIKPSTTNTYNLGASSYTWKDLYLSGKIDLGTKVSGRTNTCKIELDAYDGVGIWSNNVRVLNIYDNATYSSKPIYPNTSNLDLGNQNSKWNNAWLTTLKGIATLTQAQYDALVSGGTVDADTLYFIEEE